MLDTAVAVRLPGAVGGVSSGGAAETAEAPVAGVSSEGAGESAEAPWLAHTRTMTTACHQDSALEILTTPHLRTLRASWARRIVVSREGEHAQLATRQAAAAQTKRSAATPCLQRLPIPRLLLSS